MLTKACRLFLVVGCLLAPGVLHASPPGLPTAALLAMVPDTVRLKMLAALARGDIAGAISLWQLHANRNTVPAALQAMQSAYNVVNRTMGPCKQVARDISNGFKAFGGSPQYIQFKPPGKVPYLAWEMRAGDPKSTLQISDMGKHYAVMMKDKVYDAFTGPEGMVLSEYLKRLVAHDGVPLWEVVSSL
jgi:hypothetical protein